MEGRARGDGPGAGEKRSWVLVVEPEKGQEIACQVLFSSQKILDFAIIALLFLFDKYCLIIS